MDVDVLTETVIRRPREQVAAFSGDPTNAPRWYRNIASVTWQTEPPVRIGSRMDFVATFLGRTLRYTYEITELVPGERLVMRTADGPFPMQTTYTWADVPEAGGSAARGAAEGGAAAGSGATRMTLRNTGRPSGFARVGRPMMVAAMRRANTHDLAALKTLLEV